MKRPYLFAFIFFLMFPISITYADRRCDSVLTTLNQLERRLDRIFYKKCDGKVSKRCGRMLGNWNKDFKFNSKLVLTYQCGGSAFARPFRRSLKRINKMMRDKADYIGDLRDEGYPLK